MKEWRMNNERIERLGEPFYRPEGVLNSYLQKAA